jgi:predicted TPR repeat methyltransferase
MAFALHLNGDDILAGSIADPRADASPARAALDRTNALLDAGRVADAADLCLATLQTSPLAPMTAANLIMVLRAAGGDATPWEDGLLAQLLPTATDAPRRINLARLMIVLGRKKDGTILLQSALQNAPPHLDGLLALTSLLLKKGDADHALHLWQPCFAADPMNGRLRLDLVRILALSGFLGHARRLLDVAEPLCRNCQAEFDHIAAALRGTTAGPAQAAMTLEVFERFAPTYDSTLEKLGNRGPDAIAAMLQATALPRKRTLAILDAGYGAGLCGPLLRPYAKRLHGIDLSPAMLAKARREKDYGALTRADLSTLGTMPTDPFDMIVSSDVLVYFGDLAQVFANFARLLRPGGWLLLTVESAVAGWALAPSVRQKHSLSSRETTLHDTGFGKPKHLQDFALRQEFGQPVAGLGLATQRLALFG